MRWRLCANAPYAAVARQIPHLRADADIVIVDMDRTEAVDQKILQSRGSATPFDKYPVKGAPIHTLVRGRFVMKDRQLVTSARGHGQSVRRVQQMPTPAPQHVDQTTAAITRKREVPN